MKRSTAMFEIDDGPFSMPGLSVGHWTDESGSTGCTVVLAERQVPAVVDVRGGAPGTRETELLGEGRLVQHADAILLSGGSAFGLAAADGVMAWLRERGRGFPTRSIRVPIVPSAVIFDLKGDDPVWPGRASGYAAVGSATEMGWVSGKHGAGAGATVAKAAGAPRAGPSGLGVARIASNDWSVAAIFAVNAYGDVYDDETGAPLAVPLASDDGSAESSEDVLLRTQVTPPVGENTTIGVVACDRPLNRDILCRLCVAAHSGMARVIRPSHTLVDGDTVFAVAPDTGSISNGLALQLTVAVQRVVARAVANAVRSAASNPALR
jgi:L-aminopeptidase/D-esterase-like protein